MRGRGKKYYRLYSANGQALTNYTTHKRDINIAKRFYQKFRRRKGMKVTITYSTHKL